MAQMKVREHIAALMAAGDLESELQFVLSSDTTVPVSTSVEYDGESVIVTVEDPFGGE